VPGEGVELTGGFSNLPYTCTLHFQTPLQSGVLQLLSMNLPIRVTSELSCLIPSGRKVPKFGPAREGKRWKGLQNGGLHRLGNADFPV
jgi:hypothetical protein